MGIRSWNPAQISNDLVGIKKKYNNKLVIAGGWDNTGYLGSPDVDPDDLRQGLKEYVDTLAPGGGFVFSAGIMGRMDNPKLKEKSGIIREFYYDYVKDYYKNH